MVGNGLGVLAGAALVKFVMDQKKAMAGPFSRCLSCNGMGQVSYLCSHHNNHRRSLYYNPQ
ncbi:hypothetical protein CFP56_005992 [Quercus suber]|uniref:Uncharacterized protein n=1 Tax=Quercus suber TaxID=58331 RepID=A0AAW0M7L6_QUESU